MFVASKTLVEKVGVFDNAYDGAQDYDFILRCIEKADGIYHIPKILYHWRAHSNSTSERPDAKLYAFDAGRRAIEAHYKRLGIEAIVENGDHLGQYKTTYKIIAIKYSDVFTGPNALHFLSAIPFPRFIG